MNTVLFLFLLLLLHSLGGLECVWGGCCLFRLHENTSRGYRKKGILCFERVVVREFSCSLWKYLGLAWWAPLFKLETVLPWSITSHPPILTPPHPTPFFFLFFLMLPATLERSKLKVVVSCDLSSACKIYTWARSRSRWTQLPWPVLKGDNWCLLGSARTPV